ncbi:MAG: NAD(P)/FAD-dependent oxidoreductase [Planctomycetales bacterium]|nr:NAD(P)/FAD-dependent oxidoreductase [Planctomycetales bacterium]
MYDTIIIGAGMSGLAAGIRLAHYDQRVCILERHYTIGGLNSFYRLRGRDYDVGLHAITNFTPKGEKKGPLARLLRQLRFRWEDFALSPQVGSSIAFPGVRLRFNNDIELLTSQIAVAFPGQADRFRALLGRIVDYDDLDESTFSLSARAMVEESITDPLLVEMLFCPLMWYGNAREDDMDWGQFCIMFRSIFVEGLARPMAGVRLILKHLVRRFRELGGELKLRHGVDRFAVEDGRVAGVILDDGAEICGRNVLSSAGWYETMRMCDAPPPPRDAGGPGRMSFTETMSILDTQPQQLGHRDTIVFFNDSPTFQWRQCEDFCDLRTGVICSPNNFVYGDDEHGEAQLADGVMRITAIANFNRWAQLEDDEYQLQKMRWYDRVVDSAVRFVPDYRARVIDSDMFTPKTIRRFTWHDNGAVYGAPVKRLNGATHLSNLFICGTDQGYVGIVGTIMSGISMANKHLLKN